jgi:Fe-S cluster assembly iron-binding protein IscA
MHTQVAFAPTSRFASAGVPAGKASHDRQDRSFAGSGRSARRAEEGGGERGRASRVRPARRRRGKLLEAESDDRSVGLRLGKTPSGALGVFADRQRADDQIVEHEGAAVLLVGQEIAEKVKDTTIDYEESEAGPSLVMKRT